MTKQFKKNREFDIYEEELSMWLAVLSWSRLKFMVSQAKDQMEPIRITTRTITYNATDDEQAKIEDMLKKLRSSVRSKRRIS